MQVEPKINEMEKFEMRNKTCNAKEFVDHHASTIKTGEIERGAPWRSAYQIKQISIYERTYLDHLRESWTASIQWFSNRKCCGRAKLFIWFHYASNSSLNCIWGRPLGRSPAGLQFINWNIIYWNRYASHFIRITIDGFFHPRSMSWYCFSDRNMKLKRKYIRGTIHELNVNNENWAHIQLFKAIMS